MNVTCVGELAVDECRLASDSRDERQVVGPSEPFGEVGVSTTAGDHPVPTLPDRVVGTLSTE